MKKVTKKEVKKSTKVNSKKAMVLSLFDKKAPTAIIIKRTKISGQRIRKILRTERSKEYTRRKKASTK